MNAPTLHPQPRRRDTRQLRRRRRVMACATVLLSTLLTQASPQASTWDELVALEADKVQTQTAAPAAPLAPPPAPARTFGLSDGRQVRSKDWKLVLFLQSTCRYCKEFDPALKAISEQTGFEVFPYTLDGQGDASFPTALPAPPEVILEFFGNGLPIATPTTYLVNVHSMAAYPLHQGATDATTFMVRLDEVLLTALTAEGQPTRGVPHAP